MSRATSLYILVVVIWTLALVNAYALAASGLGYIEACAIAWGGGMAFAFGLASTWKRIRRAGR